MRDAFTRAIAAILIALAAGASACDAISGEGEASADETEEIRKVEVAQVRTDTLVHEVSYVGDIEGEAEIRVFSPIPDRIVSLPIKEGDRVKKNRILAVIRSTALSQGVDQAAGGLDAARAQRNALQDQVSRLNKLESSGAVSSSQLLTVRSQLDAAEAQVRQLEAVLGQARQRKGDAVLKAPIDGVIGQVFVEAGDLAAPQIPVCTVVDMDRVRVKVRVPEPDLPHLRPGQPAEVRVAVSNGEPIRASVSRVGPVLDRLSRTATMEIDIDNSDHVLKPGMLARVKVEVERIEGAVVAPKDALTVTAERRSGENLYRAVVVEDGKASERMLLLGLEDGDLVQVREGLEAGETLVLRGQHQLSDGDPVAIASSAEDTAADTPVETAGAAGGGAEQPTPPAGG